MPFEEVPFRIRDLVTLGGSGVRSALLQALTKLWNGGARLAVYYLHVRMVFSRETGSAGA